MYKDSKGNCASVCNRINNGKISLKNSLSKDISDEAANALRNKCNSLFIKSYRINEGLTQSEFSEIADVHVNSLQRFEKGNLKNIKLLTLFTLIDATSMSLSEFFQTIE